MDVNSEKVVASAHRITGLIQISDRLFVTDSILMLLYESLEQEANDRQTSFKALVNI